jgi:CRP-like cAMP-binding protein
MANENINVTNLRFDKPVSGIAALLHSHPLFADTDLVSLTELVGGGRILTLCPGEVLLRQDEASDAAYLVIEGLASIYVETSYGRVTLSTVSAPSVVGEIGVFTGVPRTATIEATTRVLVVRIESGVLQKFGSDHPNFLAAVMMQVGRRFQAFNKAFGLYANALKALREPGFDLHVLDDLKDPLPELVDFTHSFRCLAEEILERRTYREEISSAVAIQRAMLPTQILPSHFGVALDLFAQMLPARDVGGDFYDYFMLDERRLAITIGDVSGKGIPAALYMAAAQTALRVTLRQQQTINAAVATANNLLVANNDEAMFATLFCAIIDILNGIGSACNCGHPAPLLLRRAGNRDRITSSSLPLGVKADAQFKAEPVTMRDGDMLFFGLTACRTRSMSPVNATVSSALSSSYLGFRPIMLRVISLQPRKQ